MSTLGLRRIINQQIMLDCQENNIFDFQGLKFFIYKRIKKGMQQENFSKTEIKPLDYENPQIRSICKSMKISGPFHDEV